MKKVVSPQKLLFHQKKVAEYLRGENIFPATLELDITNACSRKCKDCPSARSSMNNHLDIAFIDHLFGSLDGQTRGLLLTGGEPTMSPLFPRVLQMAKRRGFIDIAVVTNGSFLAKDTVAEALLEYASTIRLSLYDRGPETCADLAVTFLRMRDLRLQIERRKSPLKIGVSILTSAENSNSLAAEAERVRQAGRRTLGILPPCLHPLAGGYPTSSSPKWRRPEGEPIQRISQQRF
ncbi:MAG: radical SAM protein [Proteobacteria bacterium]|nr:radical SAM protein [Pseudomonadota bacterium]